MLRAYSILHALIIALLIATVSGGLIMYFSLQQKLAAHYLWKNRVIENSHSGLQLIMGQSGRMESGKEALVDLFDNQKDSVRLVKKNWGLFEVAVSEAMAREHRHQKMALLGTPLLPESRLALYLAEQNKPLALCGKTILKGTCYLPRSGVKRAYIEGQNFEGNELVNGEKRTSQKRLPPLNESLKKVNLAYLNADFGATDSVVQFDDWQGDTLRHSFAHKTVVLTETGPIRLAGITLEGNVIVVSQTEVNIGSDAILNDLIVYAPTVYIEAGFEGAIQVFADESIHVSEGVRLRYPSTLGLYKRTAGTTDALVLSEKSRIAGVVFCQKIADGRLPLRVVIEKDALVEGQVYVDAELDMKGRIYGSLYCNKFNLKTPSSVYENHLLNVEINADSLSDHFVGVGLVNESAEKAIVKWLQ